VTGRLPLEVSGWRRRSVQTLHLVVPCSARQPIYISFKPPRNDSRDPATVTPTDFACAVLECRVDMDELFRMGPLHVEPQFWFNLVD
jgi:hypothetical protein